MEIARFHSCDTWEADTRWMSGTCENMASKISPWMGASSVAIGTRMNVFVFLLLSVFWDSRVRGERE